MEFLFSVSQRKVARFEKLFVLKRCKTVAFNECFERNLVRMLCVYGMCGGIQVNLLSNGGC